MTATLFLLALLFSNDQAPARLTADFLLGPSGGSAPASGFHPRGPNAFVEIRPRCRASSAGGAPVCDSLIPAGKLRRTGARMNQG